MSDLAATNCGCGCDNGISQGNNGGCCNTLIWILILSSICGNGNSGCGFGGDDNCLWIILLLFCCGGFGGNNGFGCGCGNNNCGCGCN